MALVETEIFLFVVSSSLCQSYRQDFPIALLLLVLYFLLFPRRNVRLVQCLAVLGRVLQLDVVAVLKLEPIFGIANFINVCSC